MDSYLNEQHVPQDPDFPFIFHPDTRNEQDKTILTHYHEGIELLYFTHGTGKLLVGGQEFLVGEGQCAAIPSGALHAINMTDKPCGYLCFIISGGFCQQNGIPRSA